jgi:hypothetical protein
MLPNSFYKPRIILTLKPDKNTTKKKKCCRPTSLANIFPQILSEILGNEIQHILKNHTPWSSWSHLREAKMVQHM